MTGIVAQALQGDAVKRISTLFQEAYCIRLFLWLNFRKNNLKPLLLLLLVLLASLPKNYAATAPSLPVADSVLIKFASLSPKDIQKQTGHRLNLIQKTELKLLQKKIKKRVLSASADQQHKKDVVSTIALIAGVLGIVTLFLVPGVAFVLMLAAIITGIIGISNNPNPKSRTRALIGLIAGIAGIILTLLALIIFLSGSWF